MPNNLSIKKGETLVGLYTVESDAIIGGFGRVFRVRHTGWKVDLAMKQPKIDLFQHNEQKEVFIRECDNWIKLGLHPNIVSCFYVREINSLPSIFAEWMEGGSLRKHIDTKELYRGEPAEVIERILDFAIQFARGLHYAHSKGLIHRDVKPDNLLLTSDANKDGARRIATAKVSDFGISNARAIVSGMDQQTSPSDDSFKAMQREPYSRLYCSPEQIKNEKLTHRTDIWSWAASVLEMFTGSSLWMSGSIIGKGCETYFGKSIIPIPESMKDLLRWCFSQNEADRPYDFGVIETELLKIYQSETDRPYPRPEPKPASLTAGSLNNHALSYLDLGKPEEAEKYWEEAVIIDPGSSESHYNYTLHLWKTARINYWDAFERLELVISDRREYLFCRAKLYLAQADAETAISEDRHAIDENDENEEYKRFLDEAKEMVAKELDGKRIMIIGEIDRDYIRYHNSTLSVCFSPDGKHVFSISADGVNEFCYLPDSENESESLFAGKYKRRFTLPNYKQIISACFSRDGKFALLSVADSPLMLVDVTKGQFNYLIGHSAAIRICMSADSKFALSICRSNILKMWDLETKKCIYTFELPKNKDVFCAQFSPNSKQALIGYDNTLSLWDLYAGTCLHTMEGHFDTVRSVCFNSDGKKALSGDSHGTVKLWDLTTGTCIRDMGRGNSNTISVFFIHDDKLAISCHPDESCLWELETGVLIRTLYPSSYKSDIDCASISSDGRLLLTGHPKSKMEVWQIPVYFPCEMRLSQIRSFDTIDTESEIANSRVAEIHRLIAEKDISNALVELKNLNEIKSFDYRNYFALYEKLSAFCISRQLQRSLLRSSAEVSGSIKDFCWVKDNLWVILEHEEVLKVWDISSNNCILILNEAKDNENMNFACFSPNGNRILSTSGKKLNLWKMETGECVLLMETRKGIRSFFFNQSGTQAILICKDAKMMFWDSITGEYLFQFPGKNKIYGCDTICFSPDGTHFISKNMNDVILWNVNSKKHIRSYPFRFMDQPTPTEASPLCFTPDGSRILFKNSFGKLMLTDVISGNRICTLERCFDNQYEVCISPDGNIVVSASSNSVCLGDLKTGKILGFLHQNQYSAHKIAFIPNGKKILISCGLTIYIYDLYFELEFPGWHDWDEGARPYLNIFLTFHPQWTDADFNNILIPDLQNRGYGWLRPEGVRAKLEEMTPTIQKRKKRKGKKRTLLKIKRSENNFILKFFIIFVNSLLKFILSVIAIVLLHTRFFHTNLGNNNYNKKNNKPYIDD